MNLLYRVRSVNKNNLGNNSRFKCQVPTVFVQKVSQQKIDRKWEKKDVNNEMKFHNSISMVIMKFKIWFGMIHNNQTAHVAWKVRLLLCTLK